VLTDRWQETPVGDLDWNCHAWQAAERRAQNLVLLDDTLYCLGEDRLVQRTFDDDTTLRHELAGGVQLQQTPQSPLLWRQPITGCVGVEKTHELFLYPNETCRSALDVAERNEEYAAACRGTRFVHA